MNHPRHWGNIFIKSTHFIFQNQLKSVEINYLLNENLRKLKFIKTVTIYNVFKKNNLF